MHKNKKIRWAILGAGKIAHKFAQDFTTVQNADLVAVSSRDRERAKAFAAQYNIPHTFDYEELYKSEQVDAVYVATPHNFHFEQSHACMQHGKAVLCEKPITISDHECRQLIAVAQDKQVFLMEAMWTYFLPAIKKTKEWIDQGLIGNIITIQADFCFPMTFDPGSRLFDARLAGGSLLDLGIYPVAFATYFMNRKPDLIKATAIMSETIVDESTSMVFRYGKVPAFLSSSVAGKTHNKGLIMGENGYIEIPDFYKAKKTILFDSSGVLIDSFDDQRTTWGYNYETQEVTDCLLQGKLQSSIVPHSRSSEIQEILIEVRKQIGLRYPGEE